MRMCVGGAGKRRSRLELESEQDRRFTGEQQEAQCHKRTCLAFSALFQGLAQSQVVERGLLGEYFVEGAF